MRKRDLGSLDGWLADAQESGLAPFKAVARGIESDRAAVEAVLATEWSNTFPFPAGEPVSDVSVKLDASDEAGGSGVQGSSYSASGAQTIPSTTVPDVSTSIQIAAEGETTLTYFATHNAGNVEAP